MNELALFAGAGGGILGGHLLGWRTRCAVEVDTYARGVLLARQRDGLLPAFPIWDDVRTFDGRPWAGQIDVVSGGFPCTDISAAGKGAGIDGEASGLWLEMARIVCEVEPRFVFVENSPMLTARGLERVLGDLASMGFDARWGVLGADNTGAQHKRDRIWIVADADMRQRDGANHAICTGRDAFDAGREVVADTQGERCREAWQLRHDQPEERTAGGVETLHNADSLDRNEMRRPAQRQSGHSGEPGCRAGRYGADIDWPTEPDVGRVAYGVAKRVDRLRCLGNGQVPRVAASAWRILTHNTANEPPAGSASITELG